MALILFLFSTEQFITIQMATLADQASKLLDFDQKLDITLLDSIVGCMYSGAGDQVCWLCEKSLTLKPIFLGLDNCHLSITLNSKILIVGELSKINSWGFFPQKE